MINMTDFEYSVSADRKGAVVREYTAALDELDNVTGFIEEELEKLDCPFKVSTQVAVAVEEIFVNIAHYAYGGETGRMMLCFVPGDDGYVDIVFVDRGIPFDPLKREDPDITLSAEEKPIGGLGIYMVKKSMDEVIYSYENGQNILTLRKKIH